MTALSQIPLCSIFYQAFSFSFNLFSSLFEFPFSTSLPFIPLQCQLKRLRELKRENEKKILVTFNLTEVENHVFRISFIEHLLCMRFQVPNLMSFYLVGGKETTYRRQPTMKMMIYQVGINPTKHRTG